MLLLALLHEFDAARDRHAVTVEVVQVVLLLVHATCTAACTVVLILEDKMCVLLLSRSRSRHVANRLRFVRDCV